MTSSRVWLGFRRAAGEQPVLLNGVPIGHWDSDGRWLRRAGAAPYFPRPAMKNQQIIVCDWGKSGVRPAKNSDTIPDTVAHRPINPPMWRRS